MTGIVLDASALLAMLGAEPGSETVARSLPRAAMSAVNLSEVVAKFSDRGMPESAIRSSLEGLGLDIYPFDAAMAYSAGTLRPAMRSSGLPLGDRACLALGLELSATVLTTDREWKRLKVGVKVRTIR